TLALSKKGVVVRARRVQRKGGDTVVKLRPVVPAEMPKTLRKSSGFNIEVDAMPGAFVCSGTLKREVDNADVRRVAFGDQRLSSLFSKRQRAFAAEHAPEGFTRRLVAEMWLYPDGTRLLELSTKCPPAEAFQTAAEARAFLASHGV